MGVSITFNDLRASQVWISAKYDFVPNTVDYSIYKRLLEENVFDKTKLDGEPDDLGNYREIEQALFDSEFPSFFWGEKGHAFGDILDIIYLRTIFDLAPEQDTVTLPIHPLSNYEDMYETLYKEFTQMMLKKIELDYCVYGFMLRNDPNIDIRLRQKIERLSEDDFISKILIPLMKIIGFVDVKPVTTHGQGEFGKDIMPFKKNTEFNTLRYFALQAKSVSIHGSASKKGNAGELLTQAINAFKVGFFDGSDNERKKIDEFIIATNKDIKQEARRSIEEGIEGDRRITFLDIYRIVEMIKKYNLVEYVLFSIVE